MRLARARSADEDDVVGFFGKGQIGQPADQGFKRSRTYSTSPISRASAAPTCWR
ncbi:hypothetical protein [Azonexus sp.]|uniref:hypothetical protein n=1 Tax=Azonexus sp. TaxID=1872668 RepID=UPI00283AB054|nr:hypothetical protein [Azonexus sp.]